MEAIRQLVIRILSKSNKSGIVTTLPKKDLVDFQSMILAEKFMQNGVDPNALKNADQAFNILKQIDQAETNRIRNLDVSSGKVFDMEGNEIPSGSKIMGGKAVDDLPPPGSRGGEDDIAAPFQSQEETLRNMTEAEIKANLEAQNKATIEKIKERKRPDVYTIDDYDTTNMSDIKKEIIRTETKLGNLNPDSPDFREKAKPLVDKITELQKKLRDDKAAGGRAGYKFGIGPLIELLSKTSPLQFGKNYMKNIREKTLRANETGKFSDLPIAEAGLPAASGAFITQQVKKKLKSMNEEERQKNKDEFFKEISQEYKERYKDNPEFLEKMLLSLHETIYMDKKADGGRVGLKEGLGYFETNDPKEAAKEVIQRLIRIDDAKIPLDEKLSIALQGIDGAELQGVMEILGGELSFGVGKKGSNKGIGFNFSKQFNKGGRVGYKLGGLDKARRAFLKMLGLGAGATAAAKSGILRLSDTAAPKVIEKAAETTTRTVPPPYFFELAEKIKKLGKPDKVTYQERVEITRYTGKNGDEYELIEDLNTGDMRITKDKSVGVTSGDKSYDGIGDRSVMEYKKGDADFDVETQRGYRSADEYDEYKVEFDIDGTEADADDMSEFIRKEIIEEAIGDAPSIKKAGGGIARMLGE